MKKKLCCSKFQGQLGLLSEIGQKPAEVKILHILSLLKVLHVLHFALFVLRFNVPVSNFFSHVETEPPLPRF